MLKNIFYAVLLGVGMAACLSQNKDENTTATEQVSEETTDLIPPTDIPTPSPALFVIEKGQVGNVKVGMPINDILNNIPTGFAIADTTLRMEGQESTAYNLKLRDQAKGILIEQRCDTSCNVWRINVKDTNFKTAKGIGVGSKYSEVQEHYPIQTVVLADGGLVAVSEEAGVSFVLDRSQIPVKKRSTLTPATVPANTLVSSILVY